MIPLPAITYARPVTGGWVTNVHDDPWGPHPIFVTCCSILAATCRNPLTNCR